MRATIGICLATYNGGSFLPEQLQSLARQSFTDWHLYARDDGSWDGTRDLLEAFRARYPDRVTLVSDTRGRLGPRDSFSVLMAAAGEPYIAFCDQDDVWHPDRLKASLGELQRLEAELGTGTPIMVHADRRLVDAMGNEIAPSYWRSRGIAPAAFRPEQHYTFCVAAGSTMLINRTLRDLAWPVPAEARMHDCWIELVAQGIGVAAALPTPLVDHRRHGQNASGSRGDIDSPAARRPLARMGRLLAGHDRQRRIYDGYLRQAAAFQVRFGSMLMPVQAYRLSRLLSAPEQGVPGRLHALWQSRALPPGMIRALVFLALSHRPRPQRPRLTAQRSKPL